jgi:uncharacterized protein
MKASNYIIYVYIPEEDEYYLVHGYSGAIDKVSPDVVKYLSDFADPAHTWHIKDLEIVRETLRKKKLVGVSDEIIEMLKKRGYLTDMSTDEERQYVSRLAGFLHTKKVASSPPGFMFIPSYECNLRCPYCFETDTRVQLGKMKILQNIMTEPQVDAAFKCMDMLTGDRFADHPEYVKNIKKGITLYGGEPLATETLPVVEYIFAEGQKRGYTFGAITNGVDLHDFIHLLGLGKIGFLQITLDGPKDIHNRKRIGPRHKGGTYDRILGNMKRALDTGVKISVRYHVDFNNIDRTQELEDDLQSEGFSQYENFSMYTYPIHDFHHGIDFPKYPMMGIHSMHRKFEPKPFPELIEPAPERKPNPEPLTTNGKHGKELKVLVPDGGIKNKIKMYHKQNLMGIFRGGMEPCGATTGLYIFDPYWKIYTCWDTVGMPGHETGAYSPDGPVLNDRDRDWLSRSPEKIEECKNCKYVFFHFGGCASLSLGSKKTIFAPACYEFQDDFLYVAQKLFKEGLDKIPEKVTLPPGIQEATTATEAAMDAPVLAM